MVLCGPDGSTWSLPNATTTVAAGATGTDHAVSSLPPSSLSSVPVVADVAGAVVAGAGFELHSAWMPPSGSISTPLGITVAGTAPSPKRMTVRASGPFGAFVYVQPGGGKVQSVEMHAVCLMVVGTDALRGVELGSCSEPGAAGWVVPGAPHPPPSPPPPGPPPPTPPPPPGPPPPGPAGRRLQFRHSWCPPAAGCTTGCLSFNFSKFPAAVAAGCDATTAASGAAAASCPVTMGSCDDPSDNLEFNAQTGVLLSAYNPPAGGGVLGLVVGQGGRVSGCRWARMPAPSQGRSLRSPTTRSRRGRGLCA